MDGVSSLNEDEEDEEGHSSRSVAANIGRRKIKHHRSEAERLQESNDKFQPGTEENMPMLIKHALERQRVRDEKRRQTNLLRSQRHAIEIDLTTDTAEPTVLLHEHDRDMNHLYTVEVKKKKRGKKKGNRAAAALLALLPPLPPLPAMPFPVADAPAPPPPPPPGGLPPDLLALQPVYAAFLNLYNEFQDLNGEYLFRLQELGNAYHHAPDYIQPPPNIIPEMANLHIVADRQRILQLFKHLVLHFQDRVYVYFRNFQGGQYVPIKFRDGYEYMP
jgi:hypothetical protein